MRGSITFTLLLAAAAWADAAVVSVDVGKVVVERPHSLVGTNIEDLNFQLYGGLYSQLIHGECFEEHVDPSEVLGLRGKDRYAVWVLPDERGRPVLRYFSGRGGLFGEAGPSLTPKGKKKGGKAGANVAVGGLNFKNGKLEFGQLPSDLGRKLAALATGDEQVSRHWRKVRSGSAAGVLTLVREDVWTGGQAQAIRFNSGEGEWGIDNAGLFREGIEWVEGKTYDGLLRVKSETAQKLHLSLRSSDGRVLAEKEMELAARPGEYQRLEFALTPNGADTHGRFAVTLKAPGAIVVDYAFLQPGEWGRFKGLPVRKAMAEAVTGMGVAAMRYNGSMVNKCPDGAALYKWKKMIGPRDERPPYHGFFNPYSSHGFSVFEFLDFCEAAGVWPMIGLRIDETERDMSDLVDYCRGGPETEWGRRRIAEGHSRPYALKAIEIGNEQMLNDEYAARVQALGEAIWAKNREIDVVLSVNVRVETTELEHGFIELAHWARERGQEKRLVLDSHFRAEALAAGPDELDLQVGARMGRAIAAALPGFNLRLAPLEENGDTCDWGRGLAHARNLNVLGRMTASLEWAGAANTFQAWDLAVAWDQGRIHFAPGRIINQPPYYVDRMFAEEWLPRVVRAQSDSENIDALAKTRADGKVLTLYLVNVGAASENVALRVKGFAPRQARVARIGGVGDGERNSPENPHKVAKREVDWTWNGARPSIELPGRSFTTVRLE